MGSAFVLELRGNDTGDINTAEYVSENVEKFLKKCYLSYSTTRLANLKREIFNAGKGNK